MLAVIPQITTAFALFAFLAALFYAGFRDYLKRKENQIQSADISDRAELIKGLNWYLRIDDTAIQSLPKNKLYDLSVEIIGSKRKIQLRIIYCVFLLSALLIVSAVVIVYFQQAPVTISRCDDFVREGDLRLAAEKYQTALDTYLDGLSECSGDWRIQNGIAHSNYNMGNYASSVDYYRKALELRPENDGFLSRNIAFSHLGNGDYDDAIKRFLEARNRMGHNSGTSKSVLSSLGLAHLLRWQDNGDNRYNDDVKAALSYFDQFLESNPKIPYWIHYYKSCALAMIASRKSNGNTEKYKQTSKKFLQLALTGLSNSKSAKHDLHKEMMTKLLRQDSEYKGCASCPMPCPSLTKLATIEINEWLQAQGR